MGRQQLLRDINRKSAGIQAASDELARLELRYRELCDLQAKVRGLQDAFGYAVVRQRNRLAPVIGLAHIMRTARMYHGKMSEVLSGGDLARANAHIGDAIEDTRREKQRVASEIERVRQRMGLLRAQLYSLRYAYRTYSGED
jgi:hypothetical protein